MNIKASEIKELVAEKIGLPESDIADESSFIKDFAMDSLDFYELIMEIEKKYNIKITDENAGKITTISSLINYVHEHAASD